MVDESNMLARSEYHSFLLRLWRVNQQNPWRISLTRVGSDEQHIFSRFEDVIEFLDAQVESEHAGKATNPCPQFS